MINAVGGISADNPAAAFTRYCLKKLDLSEGVTNPVEIGAFVLANVEHRSREGLWIGRGGVDPPDAFRYLLDHGAARQVEGEPGAHRIVCR